MQVGTSRNSSVSGGADYPFTLAQLREYFFSVVSPLPARIHLASELDDFNQTRLRPMSPGRLSAADGCEALEVEPFPERSG